MTVISNPLLLKKKAAAGGGDSAYQIEKSLRFNDDDSAYLNRTPNVKGNQRIWTWSGWVKRGDIGEDIYLLSARTGSSNPHGGFRIKADGSFYYFEQDAQNNYILLTSTPKYRDLSAWYHFVVAVDTTKVTESERVKVYTNGSKITLTGTFPTQNYATEINNNKEHTTNRRTKNDGGLVYGDGYLANVHFIDGLQLAPAAFGSFDDSNCFNPKAFALPAPNEGTTWSGNLTGDAIDSSFPITYAFDGTVGDSTRRTRSNANDATIHWGGSSDLGIKYNSSIRVKHWHNGNIKVNDVEKVTTTAGSDPEWITVIDGESGTLNKLTISSTGGQKLCLYAIEIDGVMMKDGITDPTTRTNPNDDTTWSAGTESGQSLTNGGGGSQGWDKHMDGNLGNPTMHTSSSATHYTYTNKLPAGNYRIHAALSSTGATTHILTGDDDTEYTFGSSGTTGIVGTGAQNWSSVVNIPQKVKKVTLIDPSNGNGTSLRAIEIDGQVLVDDIVDNSFHLKFNDTSRNSALGKDTLNGAVNKTGAAPSGEGGYPIYNTTDDYGDVKGSGNRTDSDSSNLKLAIAGDAFTDSSGNSVNVSATNATISTTESRFYGSSIKFDVSSNNQHVTTGTGLWSANGDATFEAWLWVNDFNQSRTIMHTADAASGNSSSDLCIMSDKQIRVHPTSSNAMDTASVVPLKTWFHLAFVQGSSTRKVYIDGIEQTMTTVAGNANTAAWNEPTETMYIGEQNMRYFYSGYMNDIRVYDKQKYTSNFKPPTRNDFTVNNISHDAGKTIKSGGTSGTAPLLTTTDDHAQTLGSGFESDPHASNLVMYLPLNSASGVDDKHHEISGSGGSSSAVATVDGHGGSYGTANDNTISRFYGSSRKFVGDNSSGDIITFTGDTNIELTGQFCIEFWYRWETNNTVHTVLTNYSDGDSTSYDLIGHNSGGAFKIYLGAVELCVESTAALVNTWYHYAFTRQSDNKIRIWRNGVNTATSSSTNTDTILANGEAQAIGGYTQSQSGKYGLNGNLSEFKVYKGIAKYTSAFTVPDNIGTPEALDSLIDTPTNYGEDTGAGGEVRGNYCTMNPLDTGSAVTFTQGNLTISTPSSNADWDNRKTVGTMSMEGGKFYYEQEIVSKNAGVYVGVIKDSPNAATSSLGYQATGYGYYSENGSVYNNGSQSSGWGNSFTAGDVISIAFDGTAGKIWFAKNGVWQSDATKAEIVAGTTTNAAFSNMPKNCRPGFSGYEQQESNFNFGQRAWRYPDSVPTGFKALCSQNLSDTFSGEAAGTVNNPSKFFDVLTYTGNGGTLSVKGAKFQPELVWLKKRSAASNHALWDEVRGVTKRLMSDDTAIEATRTGGVTHFLSDGFTTGSDGTNNDTDGTYVAWMWDVGTTAATPSSSYNITPSGQWINTTSGFSITGYTGNGSDDQTLPHGLGAKPGLVIIKNRDNNLGSWIVKHPNLTSGKVLFLDTYQAETDSSYGEIDDLDSNVTVTLSNTGNNAPNVNKDTEKYIMYAWTAIKGYSDFGVYKGNGDSDGRFIYTGFKPRWVMWKAIGAAYNWDIYDTKRSTFNPMGHRLKADDDAAGGDVGDVVDFLSNGFKHRQAWDSTNKSNTDYIYAAFAEHPFKTARAH